MYLLRDMIQRREDWAAHKRALDEAEIRLSKIDGERLNRVRGVRAMILGLKHARAIAEELGVPRPSLYRWLAAYEAGGVDALTRHGCGRSIRPAGEHWFAVRELLLETLDEPEERRLRKLKLRHGVRVSRATLYRWQRMAVRWAREQKKTPALVKGPAEEVDLFA